MIPWEFLKQKMGIDELDSLIPGGRIHNHRDFMGSPIWERKKLLYKHIRITHQDYPGGPNFGQIKRRRDYLAGCALSTLFNYRGKTSLGKGGLWPREVNGIYISLSGLAKISPYPVVEKRKNGGKIPRGIKSRGLFWRRSKPYKFRGFQTTREEKLWGGTRGGGDNKTPQARLFNTGEENQAKKHAGGLYSGARNKKRTVTPRLVCPTPKGLCRGV